MSGFGAINIGFDIPAKEQVVRRYVAEHGIEHVIIFYPGLGWKTLEIDDAEYITFAETIRYRTYYPLLQRIDNSYLLVMDECMRVKKRRGLNYNCINYYGNQTSHRLVFEWLPIIDEYDDFMILLDFIDKARWRFKHFDFSCLDEVPVTFMARRYSIFRVNCPIPANGKEQYEAKKRELFENLGDGDPDTIPGELEQFVGKFKGITDPEITHITHKRKLKGNSVRLLEKSLQPIQGEVIFVDLPFRQKQFNDFLVKTNVSRFGFLHTGLPVDNYFYNRYEGWCNNVNEFTAKAGFFV